MKLPKNLALKRDELAKAHSIESRKMLDYGVMDDFKAGFDACWAALIELSNEEFDENAAREESYRRDELETAKFGEEYLCNYSFIEGARYQRQKMLAETLALRGENERIKEELEMLNHEMPKLREDLEVQDAANVILSKELLKETKENEQLRWAKVSEKILKDGVLLLTKENEELKLKGPTLMKECVSLREENDRLKKELDIAWDTVNAER